MGGTIHADSIAGEESLFTMQLPLPETKDSLPSPAPQPTPVAQTEETILVVDDNSINRMIAADMLRARGAVVVEAVGGQDAIEQSQTRPFDLVLMDISMPEVDGLEALAQIRSRIGPNQHTRIIALTAHAASEDKDRILKAGFESVITKPLTQKAVAKLFQSPEPTSLEDDTSPEAVMALLGEDKYKAALDEFHRDLRAFRDQLQTTDGVTQDIREGAHMLVGAAAVLGLGSEWHVLRDLETGETAGEEQARGAALSFIDSALS